MTIAQHYWWQMCRGIVYLGTSSKRVSSMDTDLGCSWKGFHLLAELVMMAQSLLNSM